MADVYINKAGGGVLMLKSFSVKNFRNLNIERLDFKTINIIVGPNNSGKSNLIKAISFFSNMLLSEKKDSAFLEEIKKNGYEDILNRAHEKPGDIDMEWVANTDDRYSDLSYKLKFQIGTAGQYPKSFFIKQEKIEYATPAKGQLMPFGIVSCHDKYAGTGVFSARDMKTRKPMNVPLDVDIYDTVFRQKDKLLESDKFRVDAYPNFKQALDTVEDFFKRFYNYSSTCLDLNLIREPVKTDTSIMHLKSDGSDFANVLNNLEEKKDFLESYITVLQQLLPELDKIKFITSVDGKKAVQLRFNGQWFSLSEMSDGTLKVLVLALLMWTPEKTSILALDEPELNIHPAWLRIITNWVIRSQSVKQFFISSHSPDFLDGFTNSFMQGETGLFVCNLGKQQTIEQILPERLEKFISKGWRIGDLYRAGEPILGGWPW